MHYIMQILFSMKENEESVGCFWCLDLYFNNDVYLFLSLYLTALTYNERYSLR